MTIVHDLLSTNNLYMFVEILPHNVVSRFMQRVKGRSSRKTQQKFQHCVNDIGDSVFGAEANFELSSVRQFS